MINLQWIKFLLFSTFYNFMTLFEILLPSLNVSKPVLANLEND